MAQMSEKNKFEFTDVMVISVFWSYELFYYWFDSLSQYTTMVLFPDSPIYESQQTWILFVTCAVILVVALLVDAYGHKYAISLTGLCLFIIIPLIAIFTCITKFKPAALFMAYTVNSIFLVSPATYSLIFNQILDPVRKQARILVSTFECFESLFGKYLIFLCFPESADGSKNEVYLVIVAWVIVTPLLVTLITFVERMKALVAGDFIKERGIKRILRGIRNDINVQPARRKGRSVIHFTFFVLLLAPALSLAALDGALSNVNSDDDTHTQSPKLKHILFSVQILAIPFIELVLALLPKLKETSSEMMVLGLVHVVNIAAVSMLISRMEHTAIDRRSLRREFRSKRYTFEQQRGYVNLHSEMPEPRPGMITYIIISGISVKFETEPVAFGTAPFLKRGKFRYGKHYLPGNQTNETIQFTITVTEMIREKHPPTLVKNITVFENRHYIYIFTGNSTTVKCIEVPEIKNIKVIADPQLIFVNSFAEEVIDGIPVLSYHEIRINSTTNGFERYYPLPEVGTYDIFKLPVGEVQVTYSYVGSSTELAKKLGTDFLTVETVPFGVYTAFLARSIAKSRMELFFLKTLETPPTVITTTTTDRPKLTPKEPDAVQKTSYALLGASIGIASVGYVHFFWMESPMRLRAVLYALFRVSNNLVGWLAETVVGDTLTRPKAIGLLSLQVITAVWHLVLSWIFHARINPE